MKWILLFNLLTALGLSLANPFGSIDEVVSSPFDSLFEVTGITHQIKNSALKRVVRDTFSGMDGSSLSRFEAGLVSICKANGHIDSASKLQNTYDEMKTCFKKKTMFVTPRDDFINNIEECSKESVRLTKNCLADAEKYFPEFILDLAKSVVNFIYDDSDIILGDLAACTSRFNRHDVKKSYIQCMSDTKIQTHDTDDITLPTSKASFCQKFIPLSHCFTNMIKDTCDRTSNLHKFREDYINAMKRPCEKKE